MNTVVVANSSGGRRATAGGLEPAQRTAARVVGALYVATMAAAMEGRPATVR